MKQIIAMGGGGFSMEPDNLLLDEYILKATSKPKPKVCFVPTASGDAQGYIDGFYASFSTLSCEATHLSLFRSDTANLRLLVLSQDIIYVGGGNTRNLLLLWKEWKLDEILKEAWNNGIVLAGLSAGAICWFNSGLSDYIPGQLTPLECLGFLPGSCCPHFDGETHREKAYTDCISKGTIASGYAVDDGAALHFHNTSLANVVSSRPQAKAYRMEKTQNSTMKTTLATHFLGAEKAPT